MIVLSESSPQLEVSASSADIDRSTEAARLAGCKVYHIPQELPEGVSVDDALCHVPVHEPVVDAIWVGYIPLPQHYQEMHAAALARNVRLVNSPEEFRRAEEFDRFYPIISDITAKSLVIESIEECEATSLLLGFPIFVKGAVQSLKAKGLDACVAHDLDQLRHIASRLLRSHRRTLGKIIVRQYIPLRYTRTGPGGFPFGREFRLFLLHGQVVGHGYYWEGEDDLAHLNTDEFQTVFALACETAARLAVPYLAVDIGQLVSGEWVVIEVGDAQFSGLSKVPIHTLWNNLRNNLDRPPQ